MSMTMRNKALDTTSRISQRLFSETVILFERHELFERYERILGRIVVSDARPRASRQRHDIQPSCAFGAILDLHVERARSGAPPSNACYFENRRTVIFPVQPP
jgi:hypothetical protein